MSEPTQAASLACPPSPNGEHYDAHFPQVDPDREGQRRVMRCVHCNRKVSGQRD